MTLRTLTTIALYLATAACTSSGQNQSSSKKDTISHPSSSQTDSTPHKAVDSAEDRLVAQADSGRIAGSDSAKVWVLEISDLECPYCRSWHATTYPTLRDEYIKTGKIRYAFINFPLSMHENARAASIAAMCAGAQGKFWAMQDAVFATQPQWGRMSDPAPVFERIASEIGIDRDRWNACLSSPKIEALIAADQARASRMGVRATPTFLVNGELIEGAVPIEPLRRAIDEALAAAK
jgi:protein-disulfide isomerase